MKRLIFLAAIMLCAAWAEEELTESQIQQNIQNTYHIMVKECSNGSSYDCDSFFYFLTGYFSGNASDARKIQRVFQSMLTCKDYLKTMKAGCRVGVGRACYLLGEQYDPLVRASNRQCATNNANEALKNYQKACNNDYPVGCHHYNNLQDAIAAEQQRHDDRIDRKDIIIRQR